MKRQKNLKVIVHNPLNEEKASKKIKEIGELLKKMHI